MTLDASRPAFLFRRPLGLAAALLFTAALLDTLTGALVIKLSVWVPLTSGPVVLRFLRELPSTLWASAGWVATGGLVCALWPSRFLSPPTRQTEAAGFFTPALEMLVAGVVFVLIFDGWSLPHGYFRLDDFQLLTEATSQTFAQFTFHPHGDHSMPLFKAAWFALVHLAGPVAWVYNCAMLAVFATTLAGLGIFLRQLGATRALALGCMLGCVGWTWWGEVTTGYYILSVYVAATGIFFWTSALVLHGFRTGRMGPRALGAALTAVAPLIDIAGIWVPGAVGCVYLAALPMPRGLGGWREIARTEKAAIATFLFALAAAGALTVFVFQQGSFLGLAGARPSLASTVLRGIYNLVGGLIITTLLPTDYAVLGRRHLLWPAIAVAGIAALAIGIPLWRRLDPALRRQSVALLAGIAATIGMIVLGRPQVGTDMACPVKYICPAYFLFWGLIGLLMLGLVQSMARPSLFYQASGAVLLVYLTAQWQGSRLNDVSDVFIGREPHRIAAVARQREVNSLRQSLQRGIARSSLPREEIILPAVAGREMEQVYPPLNDYDLPIYAPLLFTPGQKVRFVRDASYVGTWTTPVPVVADVSTSVTPGFLDAMKEDPTMRRLFQRILSP